MKKKLVFGNFWYFFQRGDPLMSKLSKKIFSIFQKFQKQNWKMTFMGPFKHEQKQSHEFWWSLPLPCRNSEAVYGHPGHNGPPSCEIGLTFWKLVLKIGSLYSCWQLSPIYFRVQEMFSWTMRPIIIDIVPCTFFQISICMKMLHNKWIPIKSCQTYQ